MSDIAAVIWPANAPRQTPQDRRYDPRKLGDENVTDECRAMWEEEPKKQESQRHAGNPAEGPRP